MLRGSALPRSIRWFSPHDMKEISRSAGPHPTDAPSEREISFVVSGAQYKMRLVPSETAYRYAARAAADPSTVFGMAFFSRRPKASAHAVSIHFAQPMSPHTRHAQEDGIVGTLLPQLGATTRIVGGGTALSPAGEPVSADIELEITTADIDHVIAGLVGVLEGNGIARGSWVSVDAVKHPVGSTEYVLLRTNLGGGSADDLVALTAALQDALGSGRIGWHDETYDAAGGPVYVFSGASAESILAALRRALPKHPALGAAELASVTTGAAESA